MVFFTQDLTLIITIPKEKMLKKLAHILKRKSRQITSFLPYLLNFP